MRRCKNGKTWIAKRRYSDDCGGSNRTSKELRGVMAMAVATVTECSEGDGSVEGAMAEAMVKEWLSLTD